MTDSTPDERVRRALVKVGAGRGFVMRAGSEPTGRVVVTAAHCLPELPPANAGSYTEERTYHNLIGPLGDEPTTSCECIFCDLIADVAVLTNPDSQDLSDECDAFEDFIATTEPLKLATHPEQVEIPAWLITLDGRWLACRAHLVGRGVGLTEVAGRVESGMSGSPIVTSDGLAIGIVSFSADASTSLLSQARLTHCLPAWLVRALT